MVIAKYNLGKSSDMKKFMRDIQRDIKTAAKKEIIQAEYEIECPECGTVSMAHVGRYICPACGKEIDFKLNFNF